MPAIGAGRDNERTEFPPTVCNMRVPARRQARCSPMEKPALLVSACLLGVRCNHEGGHSRRSAVEALSATHRLVPVCPEVCGGLSTPRPAAERCAADNAAVVLNVDGDDVTAAYERGAAVAVQLALATGARRAVLKARSPSCGTSRIYDGTFSRALRDGEGVTAAALRATGIEVVSEEDVEQRQTCRG